MQTLAYRHNVSEQNARVVEEAMAGGVRVARDWLESDPNPTEDEVEQERRRAERLEEIKPRFEFPVNVLSIDDQHFTEAASWRLQHYGDIVLYSGQRLEDASEQGVSLPKRGSFVATRFRDPRFVVTMGPLPKFVGPEQSALLTLSLIHI